MKFDKKIAFYGNKDVCKQLAYVLNVHDYIIVDDITNYNQCYKLIVCNDYNKIWKEIKSQKLKRRTDYYKMNDIYKELNKGFIRKLTFDKYRFYLNKHNLINIVYIIRPKINNIKILSKIPIEFLKPSEMFIKTINSSQKNIKCNNLEETGYIDSDGYLWGCCPGWVKFPFGNFLKEQDFYDKYMARIIKLSSLNKTYCFCNLNLCKYNNQGQRKEFKTKPYPKELTIAFDKTCNLKCSSCRKCYYTADKKDKQRQNKIIESLIKSGWLDKSIMIMAGQGEVFYSDIYRKILMSNVKRDTIRILTNGTLFNEKNWNLIKEIYINIYVEISIDAATKETYQKLRCGNFDYLLKNLRMLGELRKENRIKWLQFNYVVQKDNYNEMKDFVELAKHLNADMVQFTRLNNWGTFTKNEYKDKCLIIDDRYLQYDFYNILMDPVFKDKIVDIQSFEEFISNSHEYYKTI